MPKKKTAYNCKIPWYLNGAKSLHEKRFIQVGDLFLHNAKFKALSPSAKLIYLYMAMEAAGDYKNFKFTKSIAKGYGVPPTTLRRDVKELISAGFITCDHAGKTREPNRYTFDFSWREGLHDDDTTVK